MQETIECIDARRLAKVLKTHGYKIGEQGHIYPDLTKLPEDYPWSYGHKGSMGEESNTGSDYPLPCAFLHQVSILGFYPFRKTRLDLVNLNHPEINHYHNQVRELAGLMRI